MERISKLKDWFEVEKDVSATEEKVIDVFRVWCNRNLVITRGKDKSMELTFGFPYTSSGDYAGIWNCQAEALLKEDLKYRFKGLALSEDHDVVVILEAKPFEFKEIAIGKIA